MKNIFLGLLKHYKNRGFSYFCAFLLLKLEFLDLVLFVSKNGRFVTQNCFPKHGLLKPLVYSVLARARFLAKLSKKGSFGHPPKKKKVD